MLVIYGLFHRCVDCYKSWKMLKYWENGVRYSHIKCFVAHGFKFDLAQIMVSLEECARVPKLDIDAKTQSPHAEMMGRCVSKCWDGKVEEMLRGWVEKCWGAELRNAEMLSWKMLRCRSWRNADMLNCSDAQLVQDQMVKFANQEGEHSR